MANELEQVAEYQTVKKVLRAILISASVDGLTLRDLNDMYKEYEGRPIPFGRFGFQRLETFLANMTDTVRWEYERLFPVHIEENRHISDMVKQQTQHGPRRSRIPFQLVGAKVPRFPYPPFGNRAPVMPWASPMQHRPGPNNRVYQPRTNQFDSRGQAKPKDPSCYGRRNDAQCVDRRQMNVTAAPTDANQKFKEKTMSKSIEMIAERPAPDHNQIAAEKTASKSIEAVAQCPASDRNQIATEKGASESIRSRAAQQDVGGRPALPPTCDGTEASRVDLKYSIRIGLVLDFEADEIAFSQLPPYDFEQTFSVAAKIRIFVSQVLSPYKFWFQTIDDGEKLEDMMSHLGSVYERGQKQLYQKQMPDKYVKIGRLCAVLYQHAWHRATIVDILECSVKVFFMDYGTVDEVLKDRVRFLSKEFAHLPPLSVRGCLDHVRPKDGVWTLNALEAFMLKVVKADATPTLAAHITAVNQEEKTVYMDLMDTTDDIDSNVAHLMIQGNHCWATRKSLSDFTQRHWNEVHPSFAKLEAGDYPSIDDILRWHTESGFNFIEHELQSVIDEMYGYETIE